MSTLKTFYNKIIENKLFYFTYVPFVSAISLLGFTLLCYPAASVEGVKEGIGICTNVLIPSLFPFLLISHLFVESGALCFRNKIVSWFMRVFFALPGSAFPIILLSFIGGFPVGAILIKNAYEKGAINESEGQRMLLFCVNPGPAFTFITVGSNTNQSTISPKVIKTNTRDTNIIAVSLYPLEKPKTHWLVFMRFLRRKRHTPIIFITTMRKHSILSAAKAF